MKFDFIYSVDSEIERVQNIYNNKIFLKENKYFLVFPSGFTLESKDLTGLEGQIEKEMDYEWVERIKKDFLVKWEDNKDTLNKFFVEFPLKSPTEFVLQFTKYGTGGLYYYGFQDGAVINIKNKKDFFENMVHELIHNMIEISVIKKFKIGHFEKEGLVDMILIRNKHLRSIFPWYSYQVEAKKPSKELLAKIGWEGADFLN